MTDPTPDDETSQALAELLAAADEELVEIPTADAVEARAKQLRAAEVAARAPGSNRPVDSGSKMHPQLRANAAAAPKKDSSR
jgi:hypothetical protein